ncbi:MAG: hypothetical protein HOV87_31220 [Catenulispora sp.]|nr:hypothetical protein [Catenulispora sp.]
MRTTKTPTASRRDLAKMAAGITHELIVVTPEMASRWLEGNTHNRNKREQLVNSYARDLEADTWDFNGETVKFAADGTLLDGQHRLMAIVRAKEPALLLIVRGLPMSAQKTIDVGASRKFADQLTMDGEANAPILSSIVRRATLWEAGYRGHSGSYKPTRPELENTLAEFPFMRESAAYGTTHARAAGLVASQLGFVHWLLTRVDFEDGTWFLDRLCDGVDLRSGHPVLALRERIRRERDDSAGQLKTEIALALVITAWNAYRSRRTLQKVQLPKGGLSAETFPIPR